jgi:DNA polymerase III subunit epsilon
MQTFSLVRPVSEPTPRTSPTPSLEAMAGQLEASGLYRILRRVEPRPHRPDRMPLPGSDRRLGIVIDTETTGLDHGKDEVIELAMLAFTYDDAGTILDTVAWYEGFQQSSCPLSRQVTEITGITDKDIAGQAIDVEAVACFVRKADLVIAHNARFDRPFCERLHPGFADLPWACTLAEIDWRSMGFETAKLGALLAEARLFHDAHRALADCHALLELLASPTCMDKGAFAQLLASSRSTSVEIAAERAPFAAKDVLKGRGYRWSPGDDGRPKAWRVVLPESAVEAELEFLRTQIYRNGFVPPMRRLDAVARYRATGSRSENTPR